MSLSPWRSPLARNIHLHRSQPESRYVQLATVTPRNLPTNRTVVFRGFTDEYNCLKFITDMRSQKVLDIRHNPHAEICWYFPKTREQFRIAGTLSLVDKSLTTHQKLREVTWRELSDNARIQFLWATPSEPTINSDTIEIAPPDPIVPLENFGLLLLEPNRVDWLKLRGNPQSRILYTYQDQAWHTLAINP